GERYGKTVSRITLLIGFALDALPIGENPLPVLIDNQAVGVAKGGDRLRDRFSGEARQIREVLMGEPNLDSRSRGMGHAMLIRQREQHPGDSLIRGAELDPLHLVQDMIQPAVGDSEHIQYQRRMRSENLEDW